MGVVFIPVLGATEPQDFRFRIEPDTDPFRILEENAVVAPDAETLIPDIGSTRGDVTDGSGAASFSRPSGADEAEFMGRAGEGKSTEGVQMNADVFDFAQPPTRPNGIFSDMDFHDGIFSDMDFTDAFTTLADVGDAILG